MKIIIKYHRHELEVDEEREFSRIEYQLNNIKELITHFIKEVKE